MTTWQQEAVGIEPWPGAKVRNEEGVVAVCVCAVGDDGEFSVALQDEDWPVLIGMYAAIVCHGECQSFVGAIVDLSDPDTLAAFDRRLALRLGAPEDSVREGVRFYWDGSEQEWTLEVGYYRMWFEVFPERDGYPHGRDGETGEPSIFARIRAWKSIP